MSGGYRVQGAGCREAYGRGVPSRSLVSEQRERGVDERRGAQLESWVRAQVW